MTSEAANCTRARWLSIIGIGEDGVAGLSPVAQRLIAAGELVVGGKRHLELAGDLIRGHRLAWPSPIASALPEIQKHRGRPVVVLASGDPFHYGVGTTLMGSVPAAEMLCLPQPSAFSLAAARLGPAITARERDVLAHIIAGRANKEIAATLKAAEESFRSLAR